MHLHEMQANAMQANELQANELDVLAPTTEFLDQLREQTPNCDELGELYQRVATSASSLRGHDACFTMLDGGLLAIIDEDRDSTRRVRLVVPRVLRPATLSMFHICCGVHLGRTKMLAHMSRHNGVYWKRMAQDVQHHCKCCPVCLLSKDTAPHPDLLLERRVSTELGGDVDIDLMGPFVRTPDGHSFIFTAKCRASRWTWNIPIEDASARAAARAFVDSVVYDFGVPRRLRSDNGSNFISKLWKWVAVFLGLIHTTGPPYTARYIGAGERSHKWTGEALRAAIVVYDRWDTLCPALTFAQRVSEIDGMPGLSPFKLVYVCEPRLPVDFALTPPEYDPSVVGALPPDDADWMTRRTEAHALVWGLVKHYSTDLSIRAKTVCDLRWTGTSVVPGDAVYRWRPVKSDKSQGLNSKLMLHFDGPWTVTQLVSGTSRCRLRHMHTAAEVDEDRLLLRVVPQEAAARDTEVQRGDRLRVRDGPPDSEKCGTVVRVQPGRRVIILYDQPSEPAHAYATLHLDHTHWTKIDSPDQLRTLDDIDSSQALYTRCRELSEGDLVLVAKPPEIDSNTQNTILDLTVAKVLEVDSDKMQVLTHTYAAHNPSAPPAERQYRPLYTTEAGRAYCAKADADDLPSREACTSLVSFERVYYGPFQLECERLPTFLASGLFAPPRAFSTKEGASRGTNPRMSRVRAGAHTARVGCDSKCPAFYGAHRTHTCGARQALA